MNTSPSIAPSGERSCAASVKLARGDSTCFARAPPQFAGESRKMRGGRGAATTKDTEDAMDNSLNRCAP